MKSDPFIPTRQSLLSRLKHEDQEGWNEFYNTYHQWISRLALKAGLSEAEAQDVVQETMIIAARKLPGFQYDPTRGSFKSWLLLIVRRRIEKQLKKRLPIQARAGLGHLDSSGPLQASENTRQTATVERIADTKAVDWEAACDAEWENGLWNAALARVKAQFKPKQFQMFDLYVLKEWPVKEVARALGVTIAHVYVMKRSVSQVE